VLKLPRFVTQPFLLGLSTSVVRAPPTSAVAYKEKLRSPCRYFESVPKVPTTAMQSMKFIKNVSL